MVARLSRVHLVRANSARLPLRDASVDCVVTSPPYWALRKYDIPPSIWGGVASHDHEFIAVEAREAFTGKRRWQHNLTNVPLSERQNAPKKRTTVLRATSPESWGQISQGAFCECTAWLGWLGLEPTPELYVKHMVEVFNEVWRVLKPAGTLWLNLGDCYASDATKGTGGMGRSTLGSASGGHGISAEGIDRSQRRQQMTPGRFDSALKPKDLVGIPWRVAFALQDSRERGGGGWWLRSDIVWSKPNPMPESTKDRPTRAHEYIFLMSKSERYYYDAEAIVEPFSENTHAKTARGYDTRDPIPGQRHRPGVGPKAGGVDHAQHGRVKSNPSFSEAISRECYALAGRKYEGEDNRQARLGMPVHTHLEAARQDYKERAARAKTVDTPHLGGRRQAPEPGEPNAFGKDGRNKRSVWTVPTQPYPDAHFATFPEDLIVPCILAGAPRGGVVLDPFGGSGTVGKVSVELGRSAVLVDLGYHDQAEKRTGELQPPLFAPAGDVLPSDHD